jgi:hypothetical protein
MVANNIFIAGYLYEESIYDFDSGIIQLIQKRLSFKTINLKPLTLNSKREKGNAGIKPQCLSVSVRKA